MNETDKQPARRTPPLEEVKAQLGDSGTSKTKSLSEMSNDCDDSVVSEITLDAAFDNRAKKSADPSFYKNLVVRQGETRRGREGMLLPQDTVSKIDGNDFLDGKFSSAFGKEMSKGLAVHKEETQDKNASLKQQLIQKKLAAEYANRKREMSNAKLDDLQENSLMDMFTSVNLAVDVPGEDKKKKTTHRQRRRRSEEIGARREQADDAGREIAFDPSLPATKADRSEEHGPNGVKKERQRQQRRRSEEIRKRRTTRFGDSREIRFDPSDVRPKGGDKHGRHRRHSASLPVTRSHHKSDHSESRDIEFNPNEENHHDSKVCSFVPPPQISDLEAVEEDPSGRRHSEITVRPEELMNLNASAEIHTKSPRRSSKQRRRHSDTPKKKPSAAVKRAHPKDIPLSITLEDDEDSVNGLSLIGIESEIRGHKRGHRPSRHRSTSPARRLHKSEEPDTPRRNRHSTDRSKRSKSKRRRAKSSPRRTSHTTHEDKKSSNHHRSRSKRRSSHRRHDSEGNHSEGLADPTNEEKETGTSEKKTDETNEKKNQDPALSSSTLDLVKSKEKKVEAPTEDFVEVLREPIKMRRSISAPDFASTVKEAQPQDDEEQEETISPVSERMSRLHHSADSATPRRGLWKRLSKRSSITRPISSLSNERAISRASSERSPRSPASGGSSKKSMSSSSSSDLSYGGRSSRGSGSDRSLTSPPPTIQPQPRGTKGMIAPKPRKNYTPTVVQHDAKQTLSYSERVMQGKIGISILKPTPEGKTVEDFE